MTKGQAVLLGLTVFVVGGIGYWGFQATGIQEFSAGIATSFILMLVVIGWTSSYLLRVVGGKMTYMEQRRRYRDLYDAATNEQLQQRFDALSPEEQSKLMREVENIAPDADL